MHAYDEDGDCIVCGHDLFAPEPGPAPLAPVIPLRTEPYSTA